MMITILWLDHHALILLKIGISEEDLSLIGLSIIFHPIHLWCVTCGSHCIHLWMRKHMGITTSCVCESWWVGLLKAYINILYLLRRVLCFVSCSKFYCSHLYFSLDFFKVILTTGVSVSLKTTITLSLTWQDQSYTNGKVQEGIAMRSQDASPLHPTSRNDSKKRLIIIWD